MPTHEQLSKRQLTKLTKFIVMSIVSVLIPACGSSGENENDRKVMQPPLVMTAEDFHADNDIAMTVRSLADAIRVGEPLDSTEYDFEGVLTDGQGTPLYTDVQGAPGIWVVDVLDRKNVTLRNLYLGDLLPDDLEAYLLQALNLSEDRRLLFTAHEAVDEEETSIVVYDFEGGYLRFETRAGIAPNGLEGPLLTIIMSSDAPAGAETQTEE